ncbi:hypothetical protein C9374_013393 [Naegleria lovaniensis]|uniref:DUF4476 domain-containing protein n=1 Tax=Naegleria lovaniensis TaxID=51637 RepID=A0AA88GVP5_NAELO|nr:uncharacterized protein C9374_013393 [Naegleria lovaniensis]KAG2391908.1 hypothetical protein C9374_013393 [Naegleria lovaniensis]
MFFSSILQQLSNQQPTGINNATMNIGFRTLGLNIHLQNIPLDEGAECQETFSDVYSTQSQPSMAQPQILPSSPPSTGNSLLFQQILAACKQTSFDSNKLSSIESLASSCSKSNSFHSISIQELGTILASFGFEANKLQAISILKRYNQLAGMTCYGVGEALKKSFTFDNSRCQALQDLFHMIHDRGQNYELVLKAFDFRSNQEQARKLLLSFQ